MVPDYVVDRDLPAAYQYITSDKSQVPRDEQPE